MTPTRLERYALVVAVLACALLAWPLRAYVTDDTFIHLQYARHLAAGDGFVFNPGERVYGSTSPLWVMLLANAMAMGVDGLLASKWLGALATLASLLLWARLVRQTIGDARLRAASLIVWACHAWMSRWSLSGMETPLAVALVLGGWVAFTSTTPWGARPRAAALLWALAALTRPECTVLLLLWAALLVIEHGPLVGLRRILGGLWPALVVEGAWLLFAFGYFGSFLPNTLAAKVAGGVGWAYHLEQWARQAGIVGSTDAVLLLVLVVATLVLSRRGGRPALQSATRLLPWVWLAAVPLLYSLRGVPVLSRYLVPLLPVLAWLGWRMLDRVLASPGSRLTSAALTRLVVAIACVAIVQNVIVWQRIVRPQVESFSAGMRASLIPWGQWFAEHTAKDASVAAPDIGALGYYGQRRVIDLAGLVTPAMVPVLRRMPQEDATARFAFAAFARPTFVVDRESRAWDLLARSPYASALIPVGQASLPNLGVARPDSAVYSFYRIDWERYDSLVVQRGADAAPR